MLVGYTVNHDREHSRPDHHRGRKKVVPDYKSCEFCRPRDSVVLLGDAI